MYIYLFCELSWKTSGVYLVQTFCAVTLFLLDGFADLAWHHIHFLHHNIHADLLWHPYTVLSIGDHCLILLKPLAHLVLAPGPEVDGFPVDAFFLLVIVDGALRAGALQLHFRHLFAGWHNGALLYKPLLTFQLFHVLFNNILKQEKNLSICFFLQDALTWMVLHSFSSTKLQRAGEAVVL